MVNVSNYDFLYIADKIVKPEKSFIKSFVAISSMRRMRRILDTKYKKDDLNKFMA